MSSLRTLLAALVLVAVPVPASAQCPQFPMRGLVDGGGETWDFNAGGTAVHGTDRAFDGLATAYINGTRMEPTEFSSIEDLPGGRGYEFGLVPVGGALLRRRVFVPTDRAFVRYIDILQGTDGTMETTVTYELQTNTGYEEDDTIFDDAVDYGEVLSTSDGDTTLEATDRWFSFDNILIPFPPPDGPLLETAPRAFCQTFWSPDGRLAPTAVIPGTSYGCGGRFGTAATSGATIRFRVTIPPAQRVAIMHFAVQGNRATMGSACANIAPLPEALYGDIPNDLREEIYNWNVPVTEGACDSIGDCTPGLFCVDGFCCNTPCAGGPNDCQACSIAAGAPSNGTCAPISVGGTCRGATGPCDRPERCDGVSTVCPPNLIEPSTVVCRAAASTCDLPEHCTGTSVLCPTDRIAFEGTICRGGLGSCEPPARCDGTTTVCPPNFRYPDGTPCDDALACTFARCSAGVCSSSAGTCDDGDSCTTDTCGGTTCTNSYTPGCVGGRDGGPDSGGMFDGGPSTTTYTDVPMDVGVTFDQDAPGFDAPYDGEIPGYDSGANFDGGPFFDAGPRPDGSMDVFTGDADDHLVVTGGGCICRAGARGGPSGPSWIAGVIVALALLRRRAR